MIRCCAYLLLAALTLQSFYRSVMTVEYQLHLADYLEQCLNKSRPELHCDGQCVLMQKIKDKESEESESNRVMHDYSSFYEPMTYTLFSELPTAEAFSNHFPPYLIQYGFQFDAALFRPPIG